MSQVAPFGSMTDIHISAGHEQFQESQGSHDHEIIT